MHRYLSILTLIPLLVPGVATGQEKEVQFLPQDFDSIQERSTAGTREYPLQPGLLRIAYPGSDTIHYVIDEVAALHGALADRLADLWVNDSDISIQYDTYRSEFVHLRFRAGMRDARYFHFEKSLRLQVHEYITSGGHAKGGISVDYLEYGMPIDACPDLNLGVQNLQAILQSYAASIGREPDRRPPNDEFVVDGVSYNLRARIGRSLATRLSVSQNGDRSLFDAARAIMVGIQQCSRLLPPEPRSYEY